MLSASLNKTFLSLSLSRNDAMADFNTVFVMFLSYTKFIISCKPFLYQDYMLPCYIKSKNLKNMTVKEHCKKKKKNPF